MPKTYLVEVGHMLMDDEIRRFTEGMLIGEELFKPAGLKYLKKLENHNYLYEIVIVEGRYHQIKRMFASVDAPVIELKRIAIGGLFLDKSLADGEARYITENELKSITD